jgi:hypothetical protein
MNTLKKLFFVIFSIIVLVVCFNLVGNYNSIYNSNSQSIGSVVYIENGVSGIVTINDPFLNKTTDIHVIYDPLDSGSGFIVNKNGYIITALHVVGDLDSLDNETIKKMDNNDINRYLERSAVTEYILNLNPQLDSELGISATPKLLHAVLDPNSTTNELVQRNLLSVKSSKQVIKVKIPNLENGNYNASIVDVGNSVKDEDIALLKVNTTFNNLNSFTIRSNRPSIFEGLNIYGYPVTDNNFYSVNQSIITPSKSIGFVTSKTFKNGSNSQSFNSSAVYTNFVNFFNLILNSESSNNNTLYYGTNARTTQGYSGGPVVDANNNVMGILIFSVNSNNPIQNQIKLSSSLFLSSDYIIEICKKNNIQINVV